MIINDSTYNPLAEIFKYDLNSKGLTSESLDIIQKELFQAGIVPENAQEFTKVLVLLRKMKESYGKK